MVESVESEVTMQQSKEKRKLSFSELGKLGAAALNGDPIKKRASVLKGNETKRRKRLLAKIESLSQEQQRSEYEKLSIEEERKITRGAR